jgi:hypothetical protein
METERIIWRNSNLFRFSPILYVKVEQLIDTIGKSDYNGYMRKIVRIEKFNQLR